MYIDDAIYYIGAKGLSCLSNKDENKIPTKSKQNCPATRCSILFFHLERNLSILFSKNFDFLTLFNTKLENPLHQSNTIVTICVHVKYKNMYFLLKSLLHTYENYYYTKRIKETKIGWSCCNNKLCESEWENTWKRNGSRTDVLNDSAAGINLHNTPTYHSISRLHSTSMSQTLSGAMFSST